MLPAHPLSVASFTLRTFTQGNASWWTQSEVSVIPQSFHTDQQSKMHTHPRCSSLLTLLLAHLFAPRTRAMHTPDIPVIHNFTHHIETTGPPLSACPRCLALECLQVAKQKFEHMLQLGIIRPSSSAWSLPLYTWYQKRLMVIGVHVETTIT